jgi:hypothetical protein
MQWHDERFGRVSDRVATRPRGRTWFGGAVLALLVLASRSILAIPR